MTTWSATALLTGALGTTTGTRASAWQDAGPNRSTPRRRPAS